MKRSYTKPTIYIEPMMLDTPIALNCVADKEDMYLLMELGYFAEDYSCGIYEEDIKWGDSDDTICYHSNVLQAFLS